MIVIIKNNKQSIFLFVILLLIFIAIIIFILPKFFSTYYLRNDDNHLVFATSTPEEIVFVPSYVSTPDSVRGLYMTSWVASRADLRNDLVKLIEETELNSIVIDIKDYTGKITFSMDSPELKSYGSEEARVTDMRDFIEFLHKKGVYVIARVAVFQDVYFVKFRPDLAVKNKSGSSVWKDRKGISWIDPGSKEYWDYIVLLSLEARKMGFDEINFDYIRFPSDGNMQDISYPFSSTTPKDLVLKNFFEYLHTELDNSGLFTKSESTSGGKTSADLFGMTTTAKDDMGIGQLLENALPYFDYIMPMVYPSHYPPTFQGYKNPADFPYEVVKFSMQSAVDRAELFASTTGNVVAEMRPWIQDFNLGATYGPDKIRAQIKATNDVGLDSWILWSPSNKYTKGALSNI